MKQFLPIILLLLTSLPAYVQEQAARKQLEERGEVYFVFRSQPGTDLQELAKHVIFNGNGQGMYGAYANKEGFEEFLTYDLEWRLLTPPSMQRIPPMTDGSLKSTQKWESYPTYDHYLDMMQTFADEHPNICTLTEIGQSVQGRKLLVLKISDNASQDEDEAGVMISASMHGDELSGYLLSLRLADYILEHYGEDAQVTKLADNLQIYILPLLNPDGAYYMSDESVYGAKRMNANNRDLNRSYPDYQLGNDTSNFDAQPETKAYMDFHRSHYIVLSANLHGGAEVVNYPWDNTRTRHVDDAWFQAISKRYADTAQAYGQDGYMTNVSSTGYTNGSDWYMVNGSQQDYVCAFTDGRELTLELSSVKTPIVGLEELWQANYRSLLGYIGEANYGICGHITDSTGTIALKATINLDGHDDATSQTHSREESGFFFRPAGEGTYTVRVSAEGYEDKVYENISLSQNDTALLQVQFSGPGSNEADEEPTTKLFPNPAQDITQLYWDGAQEAEFTLSIHDQRGMLMDKYVYKSINPGDKINIPVQELHSGIYYIKLKGNDIKREYKLEVLR